MACFTRSIACFSCVEGPRVQNTDFVQDFSQTFFVTQQGIGNQPFSVLWGKWEEEWRPTSVQISHFRYSSGTKATRHRVVGVPMRVHPHQSQS